MALPSLGSPVTLILAVLVLCAPLAAGQDDGRYEWPQPWNSPGRTASHGPSNAGTGDWIWIDSVPAENSGTGYFQGIGKSQDGTGLYVNLGTNAGEYFSPGADSGTSIIEKRQSGGLGTPIWSQRFPEKFVVGNPLVIARTVYVAYNGYAATLSGTDAPQTQAGILVLDAEDGDVLADHPLHVDHVGQLTSGDGYLLVVVDQRTVRALQLPSLDLAWEWRSPIMVEDPPAVDQGLAVVSQFEIVGGAAVQGLTALDLQSGDVAWTRAFDAGIDTPIILGPMVYVQGIGGLVSALSLEHGLLLWSTPAAPAMRPVVSIAAREGLLVTGYAELERNQSRASGDQFQSYLRGWDPLTGKALWTLKIAETGEIGGLALADKHIFFSLRWGDSGAGFKLGCLDLETRAIAWIVEAATYVNPFEPPIMADGRVFLTQLALDAGAEPVEGPHASFEARRAVPSNMELPIQDQSMPGTRPLATWLWILVSEDDKELYKEDWMTLGAGDTFAGDQHPVLPMLWPPREPGNYTLLLHVRDDQGRLGIASQSLEILPPVESTSEPERGLAGQSVLTPLCALAVVAVMARRKR
ncbi:MAG: outer membrane protein assembly factor BamB family protein [Thermoplasmatota archaeon]